MNDTERAKRLDGLRTWLPEVLVVLLGILGKVSCSVGGWFLFPHICTESYRLTDDISLSSFTSPPQTPVRVP